MAESKEELKSLLMKVKEESGKSCLKTQHSKNEDHGIQFHHFMVNRWGNNDRLYLFNTVDGDCSHKIETHLLLRRKAMTNLDNILKKQRHYFADKGLSSQRYGFSSSHV